MEYYINTAKDGDGVSAFRDSAGDAAGRWMMKRGRIFSSVMCAL